MLARVEVVAVVTDVMSVSLEELEYAENAIGEIGGDNRAGITGTLHRISAVRNRKGVVVGLTCRVGRAVRGHIDMVRDLLQFGESILFIGRPGVGKTTVMREISRVLSDELQKRVVVVDTSNEIGGGGDIPHPAIGSTRRMQVSKPFRQHKVMIEAVENHMPEVIIIDEISTRDEVNACKSIAERGVMLIGSAHGDQLENIIKNPVLSRLAGGVETVTLGDEEARKRNTRKSVSQRSGPSTFPFMIEMRDRHYWVVHKVFYACLCARDIYTSSKIFNFLF
ncbi:putative AAA+ ATPase domain, P-loop containing nucleoside triphosphate hydrolase [Helianthus anomalus]